ncbi:MAG: hypothetical protein U1A27_03615 [Phycisphaerae bacterium]
MDPIADRREPLTGAPQRRGPRWITLLVVGPALVVLGWLLAVAEGANQIELFLDSLRRADRISIRGTFYESVAGHPRRMQLDRTLVSPVDRDAVVRLLAGANTHIAYRDSLVRQFGGDSLDAIRGEIEAESDGDVSTAWFRGDLIGIGRRAALELPGGTVRQLLSTVSRVERAPSEQRKTSSPSGGL